MEGGGRRIWAVAEGWVTERGKAANNDKGEEVAEGFESEERVVEGGRDEWRGVDLGEEGAAKEVKRGLGNERKR